MARASRQQEERVPAPVTEIIARPDPRPPARAAVPPPRAAAAAPPAGLAAPQAGLAPPAEARPGAPAEDSQSRVTELRVSGHLMTLDSGLFCVFQAPGSPPADGATGLPGVRVSLPPGPSGRPDAVNISTFRQDGWLDSTAALVRVTEGPAQVLVTIYQSPRQGPETAPRLQVLRLSSTGAAPGAGPGAVAAATAAPTEAEVVAHVQRMGDVGCMIGDWIGTRGSRSWIEGFAVKPRGSVAPEDIEYQGVLGRGWLSPWIEGGKFCGSRGMALPLLGLKVRLKGAAARQWTCSYEATFTDGSKAGPVGDDEACEAESLASLEAFRIELRRRDTPTAPEREPAAAAAAAKPTRPARSTGRTGRSGGAR